MKKYIIVYSYDETFNTTNHIMVEAENYGAVEKNISKIFDEGVQMTRQERNSIIKDYTYYIITLDDEEVYHVGE